MIGGTVARIALPLVSFGNIYVESLIVQPAKFNAFGYRRDERGRIEIESTVAGFIGVLIVTLVAVVFGCLFTPFFIELTIAKAAIAGMCKVRAPEWPHTFVGVSQAASFIRARIAKGTVVNADEAASWDDLDERFEMKRINHQEAYSLDGACT